MSKLTSRARNQLPDSEFAGLGRTYPIPDKAHAVNAEARAAQAVKRGRMSKAVEANIDAKADKVIQELAKS
jgi:hypothetical protein